MRPQETLAVLAAERVAPALSVPQQLAQLRNVVGGVRDRDQRAPRDENARELGQRRDRRRGRDRASTPRQRCRTCRRRTAAPARRPGARRCPAPGQLDHPRRQIEERHVRSEFGLDPLGELALASTNLEQSLRLPFVDRPPEDFLRIGTGRPLPQRLPRSQVVLAGVLLLDLDRVVDRHQSLLLRDEDRVRAARHERLIDRGRQVLDERRHRDRGAHVRLHRGAVGERERAVHVFPPDPGEVRRQQTCSPVSRAKLSVDGPLPTSSRSSIRWKREFVPRRAGHRDGARARAPRCRGRDRARGRASRRPRRGRTHRRRTGAAAGRRPARRPRARCASSTIRGERSTATTSAPVSRAIHSASSPQPQPTSSTRRGDIARISAMRRLPRVDTRLDAGVRGGALPQPLLVGVLARDERRVVELHALSATNTVWCVRTRTGRRNREPARRGARASCSAATYARISSGVGKTTTP